MKRTPIVVAATAAGAVAVLAFHSSPPKLSAGTLVPPATGATGTGSSSNSSPRPGQRSSSPPASSATQGGTRSANGPSVNYFYGVLSVAVTVDGKRITKVGIASLNDGGMARSQFIDQQAIPLLEQEVMQAQSANIQGVSGASYTSAGFEQSLQAALRTLGM
jgi:uncharacterized protein with FMN-binding domain